uniref:Uncharacterized protein n=1 Tax=Arundo donax TaxID=35708 RepID=A0A0A8Y086_ARUDO
MKLLSGNNSFSIRGYEIRLTHNGRSCLEVAKRRKKKKTKILINYRLMLHTFLY